MTNARMVPEQETIKDSICLMCTTCCPMKVHVRDGKAVQIDISDQNVEYTCPRWKAQLDFVYHPDRLRYPLKRVGERGSGSFERISWDEALDTIAGRLQQVKDEYGAESMVFWIAYTKEPRPYFHRLVHAFGSPNYCTESSNCYSATFIATWVTYGSDYIGLCKQSLKVDPASKCKLVWGANVQNSMPHVWNEHLEAKRKGLKLIVVDPLRTEIASIADIHLQLRPGTDGALALGMINVIINSQLYDKEFVEKWTVGFDRLKKLVQEYPPERVEQITWVPAAKVREAAILYATQKPAQVGMSGASTTHHYNGVQGHRAITLLPALTGNFEMSGGNRGFPDKVPMNDITLHERVDNMPPGLGTDRFPIWTKHYREMEANVLADHIDNGNPYPIKALLSAGLNITHFPNSNRLAESLKKLDFIGVSEYFLTPSARYADIVLPISSWLEREMLINPPGGVYKLVQPAIEPIGESWPEWRICVELARRWGFGNMFWDGNFEQCVSHILEPSGITVEELKKHPEGLAYAFPPRPTRCYEQAGFRTPSGKLEIASAMLAEHGHEPLPVYQEPPESPLSCPDLAKSFPLVLTSGARVVAYTHSQYRNIPRLRRLVPEIMVDINPVDAGPRGIRHGDMVKVSSRRGEMKLKANVTDSMLAGVVQVPHHWPGECNVNALVDDQTLDPISGFSPYKSQLCQVAKC